MKLSTLVFSLSAAVATSLAVADPMTAAPSPQIPPEVRAACSADVQNLCANVKPGGGRIVACLKEHKDQVSEGCKQAIVKGKQQQPS